MTSELSISQELLSDFSKKYKGAKILITGGTGFLGKRLVRALKDTSCNVKAVGTKDCNLKNSNQVQELFAQKFDIVIHGAAVQGGLEFILSNPTKIFLDNQLIHSNVLAACQLYSPKIFIGIGSSCSYPGNQSDMKEEDFWNGRLEESVFTYGFTKKSLYVGQYSLYKQHNICGAHVVFNNLYGPEDNFDPAHAHVIATLITKFVRAMEGGISVDIWGDGSAEREFLYGDDAVEGILRTVLRMEHSFELINIAHGQSTKIRELVEILEKIFDYRRVQFDITKPSGAKLKSLNPRKCKTLLGWIPHMNLETGIRNTVNWYKKSNHPVKI